MARRARGGASPDRRGEEGARAVSVTPAQVAAALAAMQDRIALSFAGNEPDRFDEYDEWWTTPRSIAEQAMEAAPAEPLWRVAEAARKWAPEQPYDGAVLGGPDDFFCAGCGSKAPFAFDKSEPEWWMQEPEPNTGHADECRWVALRKALADLDAKVEEMP